MKARPALGRGGAPNPGCHHLRLWHCAPSRSARKKHSSRRVVASRVVHRRQSESEICDAIRFVRWSQQSPWAGVGPGRLFAVTRINNGSRCSSVCVNQVFTLPLLWQQAAALGCACCRLLRRSYAASSLMSSSPVSRSTNICNTLVAYPPDSSSKCTVQHSSSTS